MVKKLLKHEFIYYFRSFGLFLPIVLVIGIMTRVFKLFDNGETINDIVIASSSMMLSISCMALLVLSSVIGIVRFYKNMFSNEGYLTFTLSVTNAEHIFVKLLTSLVFQTVCFLVVGVAGTISIAGEELTAIWNDFVRTSNVLVEGVGIAHTVGFVVEFVLCLLVSQVAGMLLFYACIAVGQTAKKNRILMAIVAYFVYYIVSQILTTIGMVIFTVQGMTGSFDSVIAWIANNPLAAMHIAFCASILFTAGLGALYWYVTQKIMTSKLNLE